MATRDLRINMRFDTQGEGKLSDIEKKISSLGTRMQEMGQRMGAVGRDLSTKVTAPIVGLGGAAVATVSRFDDSMSKVSALTGAVGEDFENLRGLAQDLGSTTAHSASSAADAMGLNNNSPAAGKLAA